MRVPAQVSCYIYNNRRGRGAETHRAWHIVHFSGSHSRPARRHLHFLRVRLLQFRFWRQLELHPGQRRAPGISKYIVVWIIGRADVQLPSQRQFRSQYLLLLKQPQAALEHGPVCAHGVVLQFKCFVKHRHARQGHRYLRWNLPG